jgi:flavin reductase (DIM6/NTAB) family NADH-FMN oxidoreductase RutF
MITGRKEAMTASPAEFKEIFARVAATAAVITVVDKSGEPRGLACTTLTSVSPTPPLLSISIDRSSWTLPVLLEMGQFGVNIAAPGGEDVVRRMATKDLDKFRELSWRASPGLGNPVLNMDLLAFLDCTIVQQFSVADHVVLIGAIEDALVLGTDPLIYCHHRFYGLNAEHPSAPLRSR